MVPPLTEVAGIQLQITTELICRPRRDERLIWPGWLTYSGRFTHVSGHPSATGRSQDREIRRPKTDVLPLTCVVSFTTKHVPKYPVLFITQKDDEFVVSLKRHSY